MEEYKELLVRYQNGVAKGYGESKDTLDEALRVFVSQELKRKSGKLIDVGCGNGRLLERIAHNDSLSIVGLDFSPEMMNRAKERVSEAGNIPFFVHGDAAGMPFPDNSFDYVVCLSMLFNHPDYVFMEKIIKDMIRICKKGGTIYFDLYNIWNPLIFKITRQGRKRKNLLNFGGKGIEYGKIKHLLKKHQVQSFERRLFFLRDKPRDFRRSKITWFFRAIAYKIIPLLRPRYLVIVNK